MKRSVHPVAHILEWQARMSDAVLSFLAYLRPVTPAARSSVKVFPQRAGQSLLLALPIAAAGGISALTDRIVSAYFGTTFRLAGGIWYAFAPLAMLWALRSLRHHKFRAARRWSLAAAWLTGLSAVAAFGYLLLLVATVESLPRGSSIAAPVGVALGSLCFCAAAVLTSHASRLTAALQQRRDPDAANRTYVSTGW